MASTNKIEATDSGGGTGSISHWIHELRNGRESAATHLFHRYQPLMQAVAGEALGKSPRTVGDEDDVVSTAFWAFLRRSQVGAYPELNTRDDLWRLLVTITRTHAWKQGRFLTRKRRHMQHLHQLDRVVLREMANDRILPEVTAIMSDTLTALLKTLDQSDPELGDIARGRLEGLSNAELAEKHNRSQRTIERRIRLIQEIWQRHFEQPENESSD